MWAEMSYNKNLNNNSMAQRLNIEIENDVNYIAYIDFEMFEMNETYELMEDEEGWR